MGPAKGRDVDAGAWSGPLSWQDRSMTNDARRIDEAIVELERTFGDQLNTSDAVRLQHGSDESHFPPAPPDAVLFAESTADVVRCVEICGELRCPVIPYGAGSSLEGHVLATHGGVSIDLSRMDQILEVNVDDLDCRVQAGVTRKQLNRILAESGLFFPVDPGADASFGGMAATCASGTNAVRYGTMRENVLGLTAVLADGSVIRTGGRARKSSAGYDLTRLLVGSEGTLGVITEIQLRLQGLPEQIMAAVCPFEDLGGAVRTAQEVVQYGLPVARMELLDEVMIRATNAYAKRSEPEKPTIFFEFHGSAAGVGECVDSVREIADEHGGGELRWASDPGERDALWSARHDAYWAARALRPGTRAWSTDVCVPISRLAECILKTREDVDRNGLLAPVVGHVGDGNFHLVILVDRESSEEMDRVGDVYSSLVQRALDLGGTCTGEHGVGFGKIEWLAREHGDAVEVMRAIKRALDPQDIFNPGKIFHKTGSRP